MSDEAKPRQRECCDSVEAGYHCYEDRMEDLREQGEAEEGEPFQLLAKAYEKAEEAAAKAARGGREEWQVCIRSPFAGKEREALCGDVMPFFTGSDHWLANRLRGGRLTGCPACLDVIGKALADEREINSTEG